MATKPKENPIAVYGTSDGIRSFRHGLTVRERTTINKAMAIVGRCMTQCETIFDAPDAVKTYLQIYFAGERTERFVVMFLNLKNQLIAIETMFYGTLSQTLIYPREVVMNAMAYEASAVILAHNHPSGDINPSQADHALTQTLRTALALVDVRVLDHIIVSPIATFSLAEKGLM